MRVLVTGGRYYGEESDEGAAIFHALNQQHVKRPITAVIHGCAQGVDAKADIWASLNGIPRDRFPADWLKHGKRAGPLRNQAMVDSKPDLVVAFPGGRGTADCVQRAKMAGIPVIEVIP